MKFLPASPWDVLTSTDKDGKTRFDARKCWECGAFWVSTWAFIYLTLTKDMTEWYFGGFMLVWAGARSLRDREQRLVGMTKQPKAKP